MPSGSAQEAPRGVKLTDSSRPYARSVDRVVNEVAKRLYSPTPLSRRAKTSSAGVLPVSIPCGLGDVLCVIARLSLRNRTCRYSVDVSGRRSNSKLFQWVVGSWRIQRKRHGGRADWDCLFTGSSRKPGASVRKSRTIVRIGRTRVRAYKVRIGRRLGNHSELLPVRPREHHVQEHVDARRRGASEAPREREDVRRPCRAHGAGGGSLHRRDARGADIHRGARGVELHLRRGHADADPASPALR